MKKRSQLKKFYKKTKYSNKKCVFNDIKFDSKLEMERYKELILLSTGGAINELQLQKPFILQDKFKRNGKGIRAIKYLADFFYFDEKLKKYVCEDTKGFETEVFKIKKKIFLSKYPDIVFFQNSKNKKQYL